MSTNTSILSNAETSDKGLDTYTGPSLGKIEKKLFFGSSHSKDMSVSGDVALSQKQKLYDEIVAISRKYDEIDFSSVEANTRRCIFSVASMTRETLFRELTEMYATNSLSTPQWSNFAGEILLKEIRDRRRNISFSESTKLLRKYLCASYWRYVEENAEFLDRLAESSFDSETSFDYFGASTLEKSYLMKAKSGDIPMNSPLQNGSALVVVETPKDMYLRVATFIHMKPAKKIREVGSECLYECSKEQEQRNITNMFSDMCRGLYTPATPQLYNCGAKKPQLASCVLLSVDDSIGKQKDPNIDNSDESDDDTPVSRNDRLNEYGFSITESWKSIGLLSKECYGVGVNLSALRYSEISNSGMSDGLINWIKSYQSVIGSINQGGKRSGSLAVYVNIWHINIFEVVDAKRNDGDEHQRARSLFYGLWINDEFMRRLSIPDSTWTLFCPAKAKGLNDLWGVEFEEKYKEYERLFDEQKISGRRVKTMELWRRILETQILVGMPYVLFGDNVNRKSNQSNIGMIRCSNLCTEIVEVTGSNHISLCNLASIALSKLVVAIPGDKPFVDWSLLDRIVRRIVRNINKVIDITHYNNEIKHIKKTNLDTRPIGIGVQGYADMIASLDIQWVVIDKEISEEQYNTDKIIYHKQDGRYYSLKTNPELEILNNEIFERIYFSAISESNNISREKYEYIQRVCDCDDKLEPSIGSYRYFEGSPLSKGDFQFDLWNKEGKGEFFDETKSSLSWGSLRNSVRKYGVVNSLMIAPMPTASTAQILGNTEAFEPFSGLIYLRKSLAGQFMVVNKHLHSDVYSLNEDLWETVAKEILKRDGCIGDFELPDSFSADIREKFNRLRLKYKTVWEIPLRVTVDLNSKRSRFIDQSSSYNVYMQNPSYSKMHALFIDSWQKGLKTGMYYFRTEANVKALGHDIISSSKIQKIKKSETEHAVCEMCSS